MFNFKEHWPAILLAFFAVAAGQIGRLGQKLEQGQRLGWRSVFIELSMLPAFGALTGAAGAEMDLPVWAVLALGVAAGWMGFATFRIIASLVTRALKVTAREILSDDVKPRE